jgi:hypothetical protein
MVVLVVREHGKPDKEYPWDEDTQLRFGFTDESTRFLNGGQFRSIYRKALNFSLKNEGE